MAVKILLVNPNQMKPAVAPVALDYLASALASSITFRWMCSTFASPKLNQDIDRYFRDNSPVAVGISLRNTDDTSLGSGNSSCPG